MKLTIDISLRSFEFWGGARNTADMLTDDQLDIVETCLEDIYSDGCSETVINDIFWHDRDWLAVMIGYENWDAVESEAADDF